MMRKLEDELSPKLTYHNLGHTLSVLSSAEHIALAEGIEGEELIMLKTAAIFHDAGFLKASKNHEEFSCQFAKEILPRYEYTAKQVEHICRLIMATTIPQRPTDLLSQVLCDADLYYLGTNEFPAIADNLFFELKTQGVVKSKAEWQLKQYDFLVSHRYHTKTAITEREPKKQLTIQQLKKTMEANNTSLSKLSFSEKIQDALFILFGVVFASFALKNFLVPNHFFDGGITGLSLLTHEFYHFNLAIIIILFNLPLIVISYFSVGKSFAVKTFLSVLLLGACLYFLPLYALTSDKLLISIFGGVFLGIGIGMVMRAGAALDGIEVLALYTLKRTSFTITEIILGLNILIFTIAAFEFGIETALYSILTYFAATRSIDYVVEGLQAYTGVTIISGESEAIKYELVNKLGRGITVYKGQRGFLPGNFEVSADCDILFTVITRLELRKLNNLVHDVDPKAFVFANTIKEASGGIIKRRHKH